MAVLGVHEREEIIRAMKLQKLISFACLLLSGCATGRYFGRTVSICERFPNIVQTILSTNERKKAASFGIALVDQVTGRITCQEYWNPDLKTYPASSIKTLVALAVLKKVDSGQGRLSDPLTISQTNADKECLRWDCQSYGPGRIRSVRDLLWDMMTLSNNIATNQLVDWVTKKAINRTAIEIQANDLVFTRKLYDDENPEPEITKRNQATARAMIAMYSEIATGRLHYLNESSRKFLISMLATQKYNDRLNDDFPVGTVFFHKTGSTSDSASDAGFFYLGEASAVVLVGIQNFHDYTSLRRVGSQAFKSTVAN